MTYWQNWQKTKNIEFQLFFWRKFEVECSSKCIDAELVSSFRPLVVSWICWSAAGYGGEQCSSSWVAWWHHSQPLVVIYSDIWCLNLKNYDNSDNWLQLQQLRQICDPSNILWGCGWIFSAHVHTWIILNSSFCWTYRLLLLSPVLGKNLWKVLFNPGVLMQTFGNRPSWPMGKVVRTNGKRGTFFSTLRMLRSLADCRFLSWCTAVCQMQLVAWQISSWISWIGRSYIFLSTKSLASFLKIVLWTFCDIVCKIFLRFKCMFHFFGARGTRFFRFFRCGVGILWQQKPLGSQVWPRAWKILDEATSQGAILWSIQMLWKCTLHFQTPQENS